MYVYIQLLSDVRSLLFYNICSLTYFYIKTFVRVDEPENILYVFFISIVFSLGQSQYAYGFFNFCVILCLKYA